VFSFVSLHYKDCENLFLSLVVAFVPSSKRLTSIHVYQTNAGSCKLDTRGRMYIQHCTTYVTSACIVILKEHLVEYLCTKPKHSQLALKGLVAVKDSIPFRDVGANRVQATGNAETQN